MKPLVIKGSEHSPQITFNPDTGMFHISGESRPEDAGKLYNNILKWLTTYLDEVKQSNRSTTLQFEFALLYFNTVSAKYILEILRLLHSYYSKGIKIKVQWLYKEKDEDIQEAGEEFARLVKLPVELVVI